MQKNRRQGMTQQSCKVKEIQWKNARKEYQKRLYDIEKEKEEWMKGKTDTWKEEDVRINFEKGKTTKKDDWWRKYYKKALNELNEPINLREEEKTKVKEKERLEKTKVIVSRPSGHNYRRSIEIPYRHTQHGPNNQKRSNN
jgi:hypothetical protein